MVLFECQVDGSKLFDGKYLYALLPFIRNNRNLNVYYNQLNLFSSKQLKDCAYQKELTKNPLFIGQVSYMLSLALFHSTTQCFHCYPAAFL